MSSGFDFAIRRLEISVNPAVNGYLFYQEKIMAAKGEGWTPLFICCVQDKSNLTPVSDADREISIRG